MIEASLKVALTSLALGTFASLAVTAALADPAPPLSGGPGALPESPSAPSAPAAFSAESSAVPSASAAAMAPSVPLPATPSVGPAASPASVTHAPVAEALAPSKPAWPTAVLAGVGAVSMGIGVGLDVAAAQQLLPEGRISCTSATPHCPRPLDQAVRAFNAYDAGGLACFVVGGASFLGMITYVIWPAPTARPRPTANSVRIQVVPVAAPGLYGLSAATKF